MKTNGINVNARLLCGAATFLALAATGAPALAQDAEEPAAVEGAVEGDAIVVTGIRSSIQSRGLAMVCQSPYRRRPT